jgi:glycosyltransferase involved in cell wall biosynthesis
MIVIHVIFYAFIAVVSIQYLYYLFIFTKFGFSKSEKKNSRNTPVSVIICAKNEAENLKNFLPSILEQEHSNFEVVLINDTSSDNTLTVIEEFANKDSRIKIVNVENNEAFWGNKKYALTLGIKAATNEILLFTDADCNPVSKNWITEMTSQVTTSKTIVLGYGAYTKIKNSLLNKLIRFETVYTAMQYFSFAKIGFPYMGVGRNLVYTKSDFFKANGFVNHMNVRSGDDDLLINQIATKDNTAINFSQESFTTSVAKKSMGDWYRQKRRHVSTSSHYKLVHKILLSLFYSSQFLFWALAVILLITTFNIEIVAVLIAIRVIIQGIVFSMSAIKLHEKDLIYLFPFLEVFLIVIQMVRFIHTLITKPTYWK